MRWIAFLGRYGHQPIDAVFELKLDDFYELVTSVGNLLEEENAALKNRRND